MPSRSPAEAELLERDEATAWLERELHACRGGEGRLAAVAGEAGVGKTSLLRQFAQAHDRDADVRWGSCDPLATQRPLAPLFDIARRADWLELLDQPGGRARVFDAFLSDLAGSARGALVVVEDVHWADDATLDLLVYLQRRIAPTRTLLLITYRDDEIDSMHPLRSVLSEIVPGARQRLHLLPLTADAVRFLAAGTSVDPVELHHITGGNPFFVTESLASDDDTVAASVRDALLARARRLSDEARRALEVVAIVPGGAEIQLVESLAGIDLDVLDEPVERQILRIDGQRLSFRHELARRAWLETVPPVRAQRLHRDALGWLLARTSGRRDHARLAHHAIGSQDPSAIVEHATAAAAVAMALQAHHEAVRHYTAVLEHADLLPPLEQALLYERCSDECALIDLEAESVAHHERAMGIWRAHGDARQIGDGLSRSSRLALTSGRGTDAERLVTEALELLEPFPGTPELARACARMAALRMSRGENVGARLWGQRAIAIAEQIGDRDVLAHALNSVGCALLDDGDDAGLALVDQSLALSLEDESSASVARAYENLSFDLMSKRRYEMAATYLSAGIEYCRLRDLDSGTANLLGLLAQERFERGHWDEAVECAQRVIARSTGMVAFTPKVIIARVRVRRGDPDVWPLLDQVLAVAEQADMIQHLVPVMVARAEAAWLSGDPELEIERVTALLGRTGERDRPWRMGELAMWAVRLDPGLRSDELLDRCADPFRRQIAQDPSAPARWTALGCPYESADCAGDSDDLEVVTEALAQLTAMGARPRARQVAERLRSLGRLVPRGPNATTRENPHGLTDRELEVARELATGATDREIAARLHISPKTASHHVSHILTKLGARNRSEAVAAIVQLGA
jgi:DNA-binding CsgD family transcriptional regulator/tetratricopeptide (TPR) repeat protein